jgi:hypothetical protein
VEKNAQYHGTKSRITCQMFDILPTAQIMNQTILMQIVFLHITISLHSQRILKLVNGCFFKDKDQFVILMNLDITFGNKEVLLAIDGKKQGIFRESKIYNFFP